MSGLWRHNDDKERVRDAADIVRVIGEVVALKARGREYIGLCPFHDDHKPSMNVVPHKGIFKCFSCGAAGDVFGFVQRFHKMEFREALEFLAERFNVQLTPAGNAQSDAAPGTSRQDLLRACSAASDFFRVLLRHPEHGRAARDVIERRGISPEMVEQFGLGASPDRWDGLLLAIRGKRLDQRAFAEAGLLKSRAEGGMYDSFRHRVMFPICDAGGRVVAFGARKIRDEDEPKYLNSPETRLFRKSAMLYALHLASRPMQRERTAIITEGYTDTIACHQAGFANAVATLGTALTREHAAVLRRLCDTVVLVFDGDEAGQKASDRAVEVFFAEPLDVRICTLNTVTDAKDPDELLKRPGGAEIFRKALVASTDLLEYRFQRVRSRLAGSGTAAITKAVDEEITRLAALGLAELPPIRQALIVRRLAQIAGVDESVIRATLPAGRGGRGRPVEAPAQETTAPGERATPREHLLGCILCDGSLLASLNPEQARRLVSPEKFDAPASKGIAGQIQKLAAEGRTPDLNCVLNEWDDLAGCEVAVQLQQLVEAQTDHHSDRLHQHWAQCLRTVELDEARAEANQSGAGGMEEIGERIKRVAQRGPDRRVYPKPRSQGA